MVNKHKYRTIFVQNPEAIDWEQYWNPKLYVDNTVDEPQQTVGHTVIYDVNAWDAYIVERHRLKGTFLENLELFHFPFDTQVIQSSRSLLKIRASNFLSGY